jgi:hypothetical protein
MVRRLIGLLVSAIGIGSFLYLYFEVPLGRRTLYEHCQRIAATEPAQDLGDDLRTAGDTLHDRVTGAALQ